MFIIGQTVAKELQDAFGIERGIFGIVIRADKNDVVRVTVEFPADKDEMAKVASVLKKYKLVLDDDEELGAATKSCTWRDKKPLL
jgi:hypothetical protein